jgi:hypothetical protein
MLGTAVKKVAWVGRTASMVFGLALVMALVLGVATMAMGATGSNFLLGQRNVADAISTLVKQGPGPALSLVVEANQPPLKVNAAAGKATNLNADKLDGKDSTALGVTMKTAHSRTGAAPNACTTAQTFSPCAPVAVKVPPGKQYHVSVLSSLAVQSLEDSSIAYCPAIQGGAFGLSCISTGSGASAVADVITLARVYAESAASSREIGPLPAGTYTFSTTISPDDALISGDHLKAHTTVMVRDVSAPGPPIQ